MDLNEIAVSLNVAGGQMHRIAADAKGREMLTSEARLRIESVYADIRKIELEVRGMLSQPRIVSDDELNRLIELTRASSPLPWTLTHSGKTTLVNDPRGNTVCDDEEFYPTQVTIENQTLIAEGITALPVLIAELKRWRTGAQR